MEDIEWFDARMHKRRLGRRAIHNYEIMMRGLCRDCSSRSVRAAGEVPGFERERYFPAARIDEVYYRLKGSRSFFKCPGELRGEDRHRGIDQMRSAAEHRNALRQFLQIPTVVLFHQHLVLYPVR